MYIMQLFTVVATLCLTTMASAFNATDHHWSGFQKFITRFDKSYSNFIEFEKKFEVFKENMEYIREHNSHDHSYKLGVTPFADLTEDEFARFNGIRVGGPFSTGCDKFQSSTTDVPSSYDWRDHGAVNPVKNQGQCGSCWSFSATGAMEGAWAISKGSLVSLSEQQLVDCSKSYGNHGCNGGLMDSAFQYAKDNGMCLETAYPYTAQGGDCQKCEPVVTISGCVDVTKNNQIDLKEAVSRGPVSIAIEADTKAFQLYTSGVLTGDACGTNLDHGVLIVGYGEESGTEYWTVKNSWGPTWGDAGYIKIARSDSTNDKGVCGIAMQPSYPVV
jgi:C1A family cysteine protease